jgi:hypothetical protein
MLMMRLLLDILGLKKREYRIVCGLYILIRIRIQVVLLDS